MPGAPSTAPPPDGALIRLRGVQKTYRSRRGDAIVAVRDVALDIRDKEFVTLVGPSGCGKSTLLMMVSGLILPSDGTIEFDGAAVRAPHPDVGLVFQNAVLMPWRTVLQNVLLPIEILRRDLTAYRRQARDLLALVGLEGFEHATPGELSGGMQQRAAICRALIHDPRVLLMDEPFAALDAMTREELGMELQRLWGEHRKTVLFVTHSIPEAVLLADRVVAMTARPGRIAEVVPVNLPRPRTAEMAYSDVFKECSERIRRHIFAQRRPAEREETAP
ncbi:MAG TPA: ABC transporter ATP-binding protein [Candidatus Methylomirabilis sp.]|jgi:NitT/TauT family transport system ATP-binding protein